MKILTFTDPFLHTPTLPVPEGFDLHQLAKDLQQSMLESPRRSIGLAAPQIGIHLSAFMLFGDKAYTLFVNPTLSKAQGASTAWEGCLSVPEEEVLVTRPAKIICVAYDVNGKRFKVRAEGLLARVIQHEYDHLLGVLLTDDKNAPRRPVSK